MADKSKIEWTDATWNPIVGCSIVSPACTNCYAMGQAARIIRCAGGSGKPTHYEGTVQTINDRPVWTGEVRLAPDHILTAPLHWRKPQKIFVNSMGDVFHESVPDAWIDKVFAIMALAPQHTFQILTKRPERMRAYLSDPKTPERVADALLAYALGWGAKGTAVLIPLGIRHTEDQPEYVPLPLPNVWLGVTAELQQEADERIPILLDTPAAKRFVSIEPMLWPIDLRRIAMLEIKYETGFHYQDVLRAGSWSTKPFFRPSQPDEPQVYFTNHSDTNKLDWVICGGESGPNARPMHPDWVRSLRDQCAAAGVPFLFKQWGEWAPTPATTARARDILFARMDGLFGVTTTGDLDSEEPIFLVGKARAGRLLDGVEHNAFPEMTP